MRTLTAIALCALLGACGGGGGRPTSMTDCGDKIMMAGVFGLFSALGCTYDVSHPPPPVRTVPASAELP